MFFSSTLMVWIKAILHYKDAQWLPKTLTDSIEPRIPPFPKVKVPTISILIGLNLEYVSLCSKSIHHDHYQASQTNIQKQNACITNRSEKTLDQSKFLEAVWL